MINNDVICYRTQANRQVACTPPSTRHGLAGIYVTLFFAVALACIDAFGQDTPHVASVLGPAAVNLEASRVYVFVDKTGLGHQHAVEAKLLSSTLVLGAEQQAGQLVFDMASFDADTANARKKLGLSGTTDEATRTAVNKNMRGSDVLDITKYPTATFDIASAKATGEKSKHGLPMYRLEGNFTLHGKTRPQSVTVEVDQSRGWLHIRGGFLIKQTSFGITPYSKAFGAIGVADELRILGDLFVAPTDHVVIADIPSQQ